MRRFPQEQHPARESIYYADMEKKPKYVARIDNIYFINRVGASLREATATSPLRNCRRTFASFCAGWRGWRFVRNPERLTSARRPRRNGRLAPQCRPSFVALPS